LTLVLMLYLTIMAGSFTKLWGIDNEFYLGNYAIALTRGLNAILSTTFLSAVATPLAGIIGMVIAFLVVRRTFAGKQTLDFVSNLGGAVPWHDPGHRLYRGVYRRALVRGAARLCRACRLSGVTRYVTRLGCVDSGAGSHSRRLLSELAAAATGA
jgi:hypothetical protein